MSKFVSVDKLLYFKQKLESLFTLKTNAIQTAIDNEVLARQTADNALDAELTDIRVGYDGTSYDSAGTAVRTNDEKLDNKINELKKDIEENVDLLLGLTIKGNNLFDKSSVVNGGFYSGTGTITSNDSSYYSNQYIPVEENETYSLTRLNKTIQICTYDSDKKFISRAYNGNISKITIPSGVSYIRISAYTQKIPDDYVVNKGETLEQYTDYGLYVSNEKIHGYKKCHLKYIVDSFLDSCTEILYVFIPTEVGYTNYAFVHTVNSSINANIWRMAYAYSFDNVFKNRFTITSRGEWECALRLKNRPDFSGGFLHGDEVMNNIAFVVDGKVCDITTFTDITEFSELKIIQKSTLYDPNDSITEIAYHGSEHIFTKDGLKINQSIDWLVNEEITSCYLAMFPIAKTSSHKYYCDGDYNFDDISLPIVKSNTSKVCLYKDDGGVSSEFSIEDYPHGYKGGNMLLIVDNGAGPYNKCYFNIATSGNVSIGDRWKSKTSYKINVHL